MSSSEIGLLGESSLVLDAGQRGLSPQGAWGMRWKRQQHSLPELVAQSAAKPWRGDTQGVAGASRVPRPRLPVRLQLRFHPGTREL